jgi:hypothetical protein
MASGQGDIWRHAVDTRLGGGGGGAVDGVQGTGRGRRSQGIDIVTSGVHSRRHEDTEWAR